MDDVAFLPPHEPTAVAGFHVYSHTLSAAPGGLVDIRVSNDGPVTGTVVRYRGPTIEQFDLVATLPAAAASLHPIYRGSYAYIARGPEHLSAMTVEAWCRPLAVGGMRGVVCGQWWNLCFVDGQPVFAVKDVDWDAAASDVLPARMWHHLVGTFDGRVLQLFVNGKAVARMDAAPHDLGGGPIFIGALPNERGEASGFLTGDVCGPTVYDRVLAADEIASRFEHKTLDPAAGAIGHWKFDAITGLPYRDTSGHQRNGRPVNYPIRMIPGPRRVGDSDWSRYDPTRDPDFGHAVRFMADAIVDCRWPVTATWRVPADARPGQYGIFVSNNSADVRCIDFIVKPHRPTGAKLMCLSTTSTRVAYNFQPFGDAALDYGAYQHHPSYPILGHLLGARRPATGGPWPAATVNFELGFYTWLDREGIAYDLYTEWDLEANPSLLDHYSIVAWAGHSEYWTAARYKALRRFIAHGGHVLSMSGNTAYWRVSIDLPNQVVEVRKHARIAVPGTTCDPMVDAAHHHQMDHLPGTTMREAGWPEFALLGSVTAGHTVPPLQGPRAGYHVLRPDDWVFNSPHAVNVAAPLAPGAAGYETDVSCRTQLERYGTRLPRYPAQDGAAEPSLATDFDRGWTVLARASIPGSNLIDYDNGWHTGEMLCDMTINETAGQGIVFTTGSVLSSDTLARDGNFGRVIRNVLARMGI